MRLISSRLMRLTCFEIENGRQPMNAFFYILEGSFYFSANGVEKIIGKNDLVFFPNDMDFKRKIITPITFYNVQTTDSIGFPRGYVEVKNHMRLKSTLELLTELSAHPHEDSSIEQHFLEDVFVQLSSEKLFNNELYDGCVSQAIRFMEKNLSSKISIKDIARHSDVSVSGLTSYFKKSTDMTPMRYLTLMRIKKAENLLCTTSAKLYEIAEECGFDNAFYLSNAFKKEKGESPRSYRRRYGVY